MPIDSGLRRLALGTLLAAFDGTKAPDWATDLLADGLAGHALFGTNVADPVQLAALTASLRAARADALVAIDEEGGDVTRLAHRTGSPYPGNAALGAVDDPELTRAIYAAIGADLAVAGVTLDLAPTVDVNTAQENPIIGTRSFGADPLLVARHTSAAVEGLQSAGVAACAKHFPGHGATVTDSHLGLPVVDADLATVRARDLPPFAAAVAAGSRAIMTAHIRVPALTGDDPATFSRRALTDLLRGEYAFDGVIVTDALEMRGAAAVAGGIPQAAVRALAAGADLLCIGARVDAALVSRIAEEIASATEDGRLQLGRVEDAHARTVKLAEWAATGGSMPVPDAGLGLAAARRAVRVEGSPVSSSPLIVQLASEHTIAEGKVPWGLGLHVDAASLISVEPSSVSAADLIARAGPRPLVIVGRRVHESPTVRSLVSSLTAAHPVVVVEMGWPSSWRPAGVRGFVTTYGASLVSGQAAAEVLGLSPHS